MEIKGKLVQKLQRETGVSKSGKTWEKQSILVEQSGTDYNKEVVISFFGDKIKSIRDIEVGQETVSPVNNEDLPF